MLTWKRLVIGLGVVLAAAAGATSCSEDKASCPAGYAPNAAGQCCNGLGQCLDTGGGQCGANASLLAGACLCTAPFKDCNLDIGRPGGNGCECSGTCANQQCGGGGTCVATSPTACPGANNYCNAATSTCATCPPNAYDCDGLGSTQCESTDANCLGTTCSPSVKGSCPQNNQYCNAALLKCEACPASAPYNCDGVDTCESATACPSSGGCDVTCQDVTDIYCARDPAKGNTCVPCLADAHCRANPASRGPTCNTLQQLCTCNSHADCEGDQGGSVCKQAGSVQSCGCNTEADCKVTGYTKCSPTVFGHCIKPCTNKNDCKADQDCDTNTGECYDIAI